MLKLIYEERNLSLRDMTYSNARDMFEMRKLKEGPKYYEDMLHMSPEAAAGEIPDRRRAAREIIFYGYLYQEKKCFGLDYNDLIDPYAAYLPGTSGEPGELADPSG